MSARCIIDLSPIPDAQFETLRRDIDGSTFLVCDVAGAPRTLDVVLNSDQTIEELTTAFPMLKDCKITTITP